MFDAQACTSVTRYIIAIMKVFDDIGSREEGYSEEKQKFFVFHQRDGVALPNDMYW